jgi:hypothetical protein
VGWSLGYQFPEEPKLLNAFFLSIGKALYIATAFEMKCRFVLRIAKLVDFYRETNDGEAMMVLAQTIKDRMLGLTLGELRGFPIVKPDDVEILERAKDARNFIAHEAAGIGHLSSASSATLGAQTARLRREVASLVAGDNLVSRWVYEIEEKEAAPCEIQRLYPGWVDRWVFENKWNVVKTRNEFRDWLKERRRTKASSGSPDIHAET